MSQIQITRARRLQIELFGRFGFGYVTAVAGAIGMSREWVSKVLNEQTPGTETLDKIEAWLAEQPEEHPKAA